LEATNTRIQLDSSHGKLLWLNPLRLHGLGTVDSGR
jgi:hypothetical protein